MATPASATEAAVPFRVSAATSVVSFTLDPDRHYDVYHTGLDDGENVAQGEVFFGCNGVVPTAAHAEGLGLGSIVYGAPTIAIGPGVTTLKLITAAGAPAIQFLPSGRYEGKWGSA